MKKKPNKPVKLPKALKRNLAAKQSRDQKAGAMKDRRTPRGGARNEFRDDLAEVPDR
ncbi:MAG: hypothetical protein R2762_03980 [Bryobacteraceae bacterium]